jgi:hypothetical protein
MALWYFMMTMCHWQKNTTITNSSTKFIITLFNDNTRETLHIIAIYKPPKMQLSHLNSILKNIIQKMPSHCLISTIGDFNIDSLTKTNQSSILQTFMNKYNFKLIFLKSTTINYTQIDHIWTNTPIQQCHSRTTQTYWTNHKLIYFAFKLPDHVPQFVLPHNKSLRLL